MNPLVKLALRIASLPIFAVKNNFPLIRRTQERMAQEEVEEALANANGDYHLLDHYLLSDETDADIPIRTFSPTQENRTSGVIVFMHGGGFVTGTVDTYTKACLELAEDTGCVVFSVDYRLAPEHPYPAALEDCYAVAKEIAEYFLAEGLQHQAVYLMGDSAGGNLATVVTRLLRQKANVEVTGQILLYPVMGYDYSEDFAAKRIFPSLEEKGYEYGLTLQKMRDYFDLYLEDLSLMRTDPNVTPLISEELDLMPKTLIITAEHDPLRDEAKAYAKILEEKEVKVYYHMIENVPHGFFTRRRLFPEEHALMLRYIRHFIEEK